MRGLFRVPQRGGAGDRVARQRPRARGGGRGGAGWGGAGWWLRGPTPCRWPGWQGEGWAVGVAFYLCDRGGVSFPQGISTITLRARLLILRRSGSGPHFMAIKRLSAC